jgi:hypothetical protein
MRARYAVAAVDHLSRGGGRPTQEDRLAVVRVQVHTDIVIVGFGHGEVVMAWIEQSGMCA